MNTHRDTRNACALIGRDRIEAVVDDFYERVKRHPTLAVPFASVVDWDEHKAHLAHFWWVSLGGERYRSKPYNVGAKHYEAGVTDPLVDDWLALFRRTLDDHLPNELADLWHARASRMGESIRMMAEFYADKARRPDILARPATAGA